MSLQFPNLKPISTLVHTETQWTVHGHVVFMEKLKPFGVGQVRFSFTIQDSSGQLRCTFYDTLAKGAQKYLKLGHTYFITNGKLSLKRFAAGDYTFDCVLDKQTRINPDADAPVVGVQPVPIISSFVPRIEFTPLSQCHGVMDRLVNVIGFITKVEEHKTFLKANDSMGSRRVIELTDDTGSVSVTFWDRDAALPTDRFLMEPLLCIQNARTNYFNGKLQLSLTRQSVLNWEFSGVEAARLQTWYIEQQRERQREKERVRQRQLERNRELAQIEQDRRNQAIERSSMRQEDVRFMRIEAIMNRANISYGEAAWLLDKCDGDETRLTPQLDSFRRNRRNQKWELDKRDYEDNVIKHEASSVFVATLISIVDLNKDCFESYCWSCEKKLTRNKFWCKACDANDPLVSYSITGIFATNTEYKKLKLSDGLVCKVLGKSADEANIPKLALPELRACLSPLLFIQHEFVIVNDVVYLASM